MEIHSNPVTITFKGQVDKNIVKKQPYQLLNTNLNFFQVLMPRTVIKADLHGTIFVTIVIKIRDDFPHEIHDDFVSDLH